MNSIDAVDGWLSNPDNINCFKLDAVGRINTINYQSVSAGPLERTELFFQGCTRACPGCFSVDTWDMASGDLMTVSDALKVLFGSSQITICGGEPLLQHGFLKIMLTALRTMYNKLGIDQPSILLYSGYTFFALSAMPTLWASIALRSLVDMVVSGEFIEDQVCMERETDFIGSKNQEFSMLNDGVPYFSVSAEEANDIMSDPQSALAVDNFARLVRSRMYSSD